MINKQDETLIANPTLLQSDGNVSEKSSVLLSVNQLISDGIKKTVDKQTGKVNLFGLNKKELDEFLNVLGEKPYRTIQLMKWIYHRGIVDFDLMSDISKVTREKLKAVASLDLPKIVLDQPSVDGTQKWLIQLDSGNCIEMVYIPEDDRGTLCVSSQIGCALECTFCSTAQQGFNRNLTTAEMVGQLMLAKKMLGEYALSDRTATDRIVTNVVLMGMGEPLLNFNNVVKFVEIMQNDFGFGLSKRRITLSTSGIVPAIYKLKEVSDVSLAISLHAPYDMLRDVLVPINKKYPIAQLLEACRAYLVGTPHRKITWEYVMLEGINDKDEDAHALAVLIKDIPGKVNLIPFNPFPDTRYKRSSNNRINSFRQILMKYDLVTVTRKTRGEDIDAACGQLAGKVNDKSNRNNKLH